jgi:hypothetical protein
MDERQAYEFYLDPDNQVPAGAGQRRQGRRLSATVPVRFPQEMIEAVRRFAGQDGVTVSTWIRRLVGKEIQHRQPSSTAVTSEAPAVYVQYQGDISQSLTLSDTNTVPALC